VFPPSALPRAVDVPSGSIAAMVVDFLVSGGPMRCDYSSWPKIEKLFRAERVRSIFSIAGEALFRDARAAN